jgi:hypothetical protein
VRADHTPKPSDRPVGEEGARPGRRIQAVPGAQRRAGLRFLRRPFPVSRSRREVGPHSFDRTYPSSTSATTQKRLPSGSTRTKKSSPGVSRGRSESQLGRPAARPGRQVGGVEVQMHPAELSERWQHLRPSSTRPLRPRRESRRSPRRAGSRASAGPPTRSEPVGARLGSHLVWRCRHATASVMSATSHSPASSRTQPVESGSASAALSNAERRAKPTTRPPRAAAIRSHAARPAAAAAPSAAQAIRNSRKPTAQPTSSSLVLSRPPASQIARAFSP